MKILIKEKKWNIFMGNIILICEVKEKNGIFTIEFLHNETKFMLKSTNIDKTLKYLEELFLNKEQQISA